MDPACTYRFHLAVAEHVLRTAGVADATAIVVAEERWQWGRLAWLYGASAVAVPFVGGLVDDWAVTWPELLDAAELLGGQ